MDDAGNVTGGTLISGQTGATLAAAHFTGHIEGVEHVVDTNGKFIDCHSLLWFKYTGAELATSVTSLGTGWSGTISSFVHAAGSATSTITVPLSLVAGGVYGVMWTQGANQAGDCWMEVVGGGRKIPISHTPRNHRWVKVFTALAGENGIRITSTQSNGSSFAGLSVGRIA